MLRCCLPLLALAVLSVTGRAQEAPVLRFGEGEDGARFELGPTVGFRLLGEGEEPLLHVGGVVAVDLADYDDRNTRDSGLRIDRAVARIEGRYGDLDWRIAPDLKGIDTQHGLDEAWVAYWPSDAFRVTAGLMEVPLTIESAIQEEKLAFIGYAFPTYLDTRTDLALRVDGEIEDGLLSYALAGTAGEGFDRLGNTVHGQQLSASATVYPFRATEVAGLCGFFVTGSYAYTVDWEGPLIVANPFRTRLFKVGTFEADKSAFWDVGYGLDLGPFRIAHEWVTGGYRGVESPQGEQSLPDGTTAWSASASWMITGEEYDSRPFRLRKGGHRSPVAEPLLWGEPAGFGALELAVRYSNGDIDRDYFRLGFTDYTVSSQEFRSFDVALNWYPITNLKAAVQVVRTLADSTSRDPLGGGGQGPEELSGRGRETSLFFRLQYTF